MAVVEIMEQPEQLPEEPLAVLQLVGQPVEQLVEQPVEQLATVSPQ